MLLFALFTLGYFFGVVSALAVFPPGVKEIEEQEVDALEPLLNMSKNTAEGQETFDLNRTIETSVFPAA